MLLVFFILTGGSTYIFVDTALTITTFFQSSDPAQLRSVWLFVLTILWPTAAVLFYFIVQMGVVVRVLREKKPLRQSIVSPPFTARTDKMRYDRQCYSSERSLCSFSRKERTTHCRTRFARERDKRWTDRFSGRCWRRARWWCSSSRGSRLRSRAGMISSCRNGSFFIIRFHFFLSLALRFWWCAL